MGTLILASMYLLDKITNTEPFNYPLDVYIKDEESKETTHFTIDIISLQWINNIEDESVALYLKPSIIVAKYNPTIIQNRLNLILKECNQHYNQRASKLIEYYLTHETETWLYKNNPLGTFSLHDFSLPNGKRYPPDNVEAWENFNYRLNVDLKASTNQQIYHFSINIISPLWFEKAIKQEEAIYVKSAIVMKYYDEKLIKQRLETIINSCNKCGPEYAFSILTHYLEYEKESELY